MGRLLTFAALAVFAGAGRAALAYDFDFSADLRAVHGDGETSYLNGGLGKLRFDPDHDGLRLGYLRAGLHGDLGQFVHFNIEAVTYADHDRNPADLTEAYLDIRPYPHALWRSRFKVGEELRTVGAEYNLDWLGLQRGWPFEVGFTGAVYGWNDPAGTMIATSGWTLNDRQTTLFGRVGAQANSPRMVYDISHRVGYYDGLTIRYRDTLELRALHYDNRADPGVYSPVVHNFAWRTIFDSLGARWEPLADWTIIAQRLHGVTHAGENADGEYNDWYFDSAFTLVSWSHGPHRLTARYDRFKMQQTDSLYGFYGSDDGHAWTFAYSYEVNAHWSVALESLDIYSEMPARVSFNAPVAASEREVQLAVRLEL